MMPVRTLASLEGESMARQVSRAKVHVPDPAPREINVGGEAYVLKLALIHTRDVIDRTTPALLTVLRDCGMIDLEGGEDILMIYVPKDMTRV